MKNNQRTIKGISATLTSAVMYGVVPMICTLLDGYGVNTTMNLIITSLFGSAILLVLIKVKKIPLCLPKKTRIELQLFVGLLAGGTSLLLLLSYNYLPGGIATALHFLYPCIITLAGIVFFKERVTACKVVAVAFCLLSTIVFCRENKSVPGQMVGIVLAVCSAFCYSGFTVSSEHSSISNVNPYIISLYMSAYTLLISVVYGIFTHSIGFKGINGRAVLLIVVLELLHILFHTIWATPMYQIGVRLIGASSAAILSAFEPITALLLSAFVLSENVLASQWIGAMLIVASVILTAVDDLRHSGS